MAVDGRRLSEIRIHHPVMAKIGTNLKAGSALFG